MVTAAQGEVSNYDGVIGLSTGNAEADGTASDKLFIDALNDADAARLDERLFAFSFQGDSSTFDVGATRTEAMRVGSTVTYIDVEDSDFGWSASVTGVRFGNLARDEWGVESKLAQIDSATTCTHVPSDIYEWYMEQVRDFTFNENVYSSWASELGTIVSCDHADHMPTVEFLLGGYWVEYAPQDYVQAIYQDGTMIGECYLCFQDAGNEDRWILGNQFLQGYYSVFNMDDQQFGFAPGAASGKVQLTAGDDPTRFAELDVGLVSGLSVAIAALIGISVWIIVQYLCKGI